MQSMNRLLVVAGCRPAAVLKIGCSLYTSQADASCVDWASKRQQQRSSTRPVCSLDLVNGPCAESSAPIKNNDEKISV